LQAGIPEFYSDGQRQLCFVMSVSHEE